jgi:hypothetical protein
LAKGRAPLLGEGRVRQLQGEVGPTSFRHLVVAGAPGGAGKGALFNILIFNLAV